MPRIFGGPGIFPSNAAVPGYGDELLLQAGATWTIPAGDFLVTSITGLSQFQQFDPITETWRPVGNTPPGPIFVTSEGNNYRMANQSGCAVGAFVTAKGSGYTSAPLVVPTTGSSKWGSIVGGVLTSVAVTNGGSGYIYPPLVFFDLPVGTLNAGLIAANGAAIQPGFMATAYATLTSGAVTSITLTDQGAGYTNIPNVYIVPDPRDLTGGGATATAVTGGANQLTGLVCYDHGSPVTAAGSLTISGGGGTAGAGTIIYDFAVTGIGVTGGGTGFPVSGLTRIVPISPLLTGAAWTNPTMETALLLGRDATLTVPTTGGGALTATGAAGFGGSYPAAPVSFGILGGTLITGSPTLTFTIGGLSDTIIIAQV
jgi:hypothetical protein